MEPSKGYHRQCPRSLVDKPLRHFFKIILPSTLAEKKLKIPDKFVQNFGHELGDAVNLIVPNGRDWKVGLARSEKDIWFDDGWHELQEHHSVHTGCFLVFGYRGFSNFTLLIFDESACEIEYPHYDERPIYNDKCLIPHGLEMEDNDSVAILGSSIQFQCSSSLKRKVWGEGVIKGESGSKTCTPPVQNPQSKKRYRGASSMVSHNNKHFHDTRSKETRMEELIEITNVEANESRRGKSNENGMSSPHGSLVKIKESRIAEVQLGDNELPPLPKNDEDVGVVSTEMFGCMDTSPESERATELSTEYEEDVETITSEMLRRMKISPESERAIQAARMLKPKNPSFMIVLRPYNCHKNVLYVPARFARRYASRFQKVIKLQVSDGREWDVHVRKECGRVDLGVGWNSFCRENKLEEGDVCIFEMIKNDVLKISTFRGSELLVNQEEDKEIITSKMFGCTAASPESERAIEAARMFKPENPSFMVLLRPQTRRINFLYVPARFARRYLSRSHESINLQVSGGREWVVHVGWRRNGRVELGRGWSAFCRANKLVGGDVCVFELIKNDVLRTSIFRAMNLLVSSDDKELTKCEEDAEIITSKTFASRKASLGSERAIQAATMLKPENPSFMVLLNKYNCHNNVLYVPARFARRYISRFRKCIKLQVYDGREWDVRLVQNDRGRVDLGAGWFTFCRDNKLEGGEVCVFELIKTDVLKISIFRVGQDVKPEE